MSVLLTLFTHRDHEHHRKLQPKLNAEIGILRSVATSLNDDTEQITMGDRYRYIHKYREQQEHANPITSNADVSLTL